MTTLWSGRFDAAPDAATFEWGSSFSFDRRLFEDDVTGSIAWAKAMPRNGFPYHFIIGETILRWKRTYLCCGAWLSH